jgi:hypothetical protein
MRKISKYRLAIARGLENLVASDSFWSSSLMPLTMDNLVPYFGEAVSTRSSSMTHSRAIRSSSVNPIFARAASLAGSATGLRADVNTPNASCKNSGRTGRACFA